MKQINVKLLAILFLSTLTTLIGAFFLYEFQKSRNADGLLTRAEAQIEAENYRDGVKYLRRYVSLRPDDNEQWAKLALTMQKHANQLRKTAKLSPQLLGRAYAMVEEALRRNPGNRELRMNATEFLMGYFRWSDAISHLKLLMQDEGKDDPELMVKLATCYVGSGQDEKAVPLLCAMVGFDRNEKAFDLTKATAPDRPEAYALLAQIYTFRHRDDQAGNMVIDQLVKVNPDNYDAYLKRANYYTAQRDSRFKEEIDTSIERALELEPDKPATVLAAARRAMKTKRYDEAKLLYERCLEIEPDSVAAYRGLASWGLNVGDTKEAIRYLNKGLEQHESNMDLLWARVNIELEMRDLDAVQKTREQLQALKYQRPYLDFLDGRIDLAKGDWFNASQKLEEARIPLAQYQPSWLPGLDGSLAFCYEKMNQHDKRLKAVRRIVDANPSNLKARWGVVQAMLAQRQFDKATAEYANIERLLEGQSQKVAPAFLTYQLQMELLQQNRLNEENRDYRDADEIVRQINESGMMNDPAAAELVQKYYLVKGDDKRAAAVMDYRRKNRPNDPSLILNDVREVAAKEGLEAALVKLDEVSNGVGDPIAVRMLRCELLARIRPEEAKERLRILEADLSSVSDSRRLAITRGIGRIYLLMSDIDNTRRVWEALAKDRPQDIQVKLSMIELAMQAGDDEGIDKIMSDIESLVGRDSAEWKWGEAVRIAWRVRNEQAPASELDEAQSLLSQAIGQRDGWESLYRLAGEIHMMKNEPGAAIEMLEKSVQLTSGRPIVYRNLARLYYDAGRHEESEKMLRLVPPAMRSQMDRRIQMDILARRNQLPKELPYDKNSTDPSDHLWVGKLLTNAKRFDEAEESFRKTIELRPSLREAWASLAKMQIAAGAEEEARKTLRDAQLKLSENDIPVFLGTSYSLMREWDDAADNFKIALQANPGNASLLRALADVYVNARRNEDALVVIEKLLKDATPNDPHASFEVRWARQTKAKILAGDGAYHAFAEARKLIEQNAPKDGIMSPPDLVLWARLSAARPDGLSREQAIKKLEEAKESRDLLPSEMRILADLYQRQDRWVECKSVMLDLLADNPNDMNLLDPWLQWLLAHDDEQETARWLENCAPNSITELRTRAHLDARRGNSEKAVKRLERLIPADLSAKDAGILQVVAQIVEQMGEYDPRMYGVSEKVWRRFVKAQPGESLALAAFLGRRGGNEDVPEALRICGEHLNNGKQLAALQMAVAILRRNRTVTNLEKYESIVRDWFEKIQASRPDNLTLLLQRAEFEDVVGNFVGAENYLREYMNRSEVSDRQRAIVANNLAYMLSLRGQTEEPRKLVEFAMQILGPTADLRDTLGMVYLAKGDTARAVQEFEAAIGDGGATAFKYLHVAMAKHIEGDDEGAAEAVKRSHEMKLTVDQLSVLERSNYDQLIEVLLEKGVINEDDLKVAAE